MTKTIYCNEGQSTASIIVNGLEYESENPPLFVEVLFGYAELKWFDDGIDERHFLYRFDPLVGQIRQDILNGTLVFYYSEGGGEESLVASVPGQAGRGAAIFISNEYFLRAWDAEGDIYTHSGTQVGYTVKCDGCEPGECKGKQSKFPGYVCMDCKKMINQTINMRNRLNGI